MTTPTSVDGGGWITPSVPVAPPPLAALIADVFGARLPLAVRYVEWLATAGVERGLIGPRETGRLWDRHLLNCAVIAALIAPGSAVVDLGSGAGLPGIALAIARPDLRITLVESMLRRTSFLEVVVADLGLSGVEIRRARAEELKKPRLQADVVAARAVAPIARLAALAAPLLRPGGQLLALKGAGVVEEVTVGWPGLRRAAMVDGAALFAIRPARSAGDAVAAGERPADSTLAAVDVVERMRWRSDGEPELPPLSGTSHGTAADDAALALVLRLHRSPHRLSQPRQPGLG